MISVDPDVLYQDLPEEQQLIVQWWIRMGLETEICAKNGAWVSYTPYGHYPPHGGLRYRLKP
jgi:hypothetical protein